MSRIKTKLLLYATAILSIGFLTALITSTMGFIRREGLSRDFLQQIRAVPPSSNRTVLAVFAIIACIVLIEFTLDLACGHGQRTLLLYCALFLELVFSIVINYFLCCTYRNAIYLVIGNTVIYPVRVREKLAFIFLASLCYIFIEINQVAGLMLPYNFQTLIGYLGDGGARWLGVMSALRTLNDISFIVLCLWAISATTGEKQQIEALNSALTRTVDELHVSNVQLKLQAKRDEEYAISKERLRFSREMHDIIGHVLTGVVVGLSACETLVRDKNEQLSGQLKSLSTLASNGLGELRRAIHDIRSQSEEGPSLLDNINELVGAIAACVDIDIETSIMGEPKARLNSIQENMIYRIVQEGITNAVRHAHADRLKMCIQFETDYVHIEMFNNGRVDDHHVEGFGLSNMRERVTSAGGTMRAGATNDLQFALFIDIPWTRG